MARRKDDDRTWGMRATESLLHVFGPASIKRDAPRPPSEADLAKEAALHQRLQRVTRSDGHTYLVDRD
ncbi:hypothetical protein LEP48_02290 [Isoptericola sp. NEAU-Y5]|uniref:Uncharacterized protein n=1 Tax=Isoptericola luteus TaxID=2879484 RepID=A0ABS7ZAT9_9MICO|nr:hypothetical protein [Isoptericola sp. NEAU-Y5]MCA5892178.1 hypothetical protein [Isoptericola sp. NEAU-Y5]